MNEAYLCAKCKKEIKKGESSISTVKNLKKLFYHARCFGADYLDASRESTEPSPAAGKETA